MGENSITPWWGRVGGPDSKAHLLAGSMSDRAFCGTKRYSGNVWVEAPYNERCKNCLATLEVFFEAAHEPPQELVTDQVVVIATRPASQADDPLGPIVQRDLSSKHKSWTVKVEPTSLDPTDT